MIDFGFDSFGGDDDEEDEKSSVGEFADSVHDSIYGSDDDKSDDDKEDD